jgi:uncharacterized protein (DUF924 family)
MSSPDEILSFWFPPGFDRDEAAVMAQGKHWFGGGTDAEIARRFAGPTETALDGGLVEWEKAPRDRLALILVLDQFPRSLYRGSPRAFAGAERAERLTLRTLDQRENEALTTFEQAFLSVVLSHSEDLALHDRSVAWVEKLATTFPPVGRKWADLCLSQSRAHREEIARFGRHPSRNPILGRATTPEEQHYLDTEGPAYRRPERNQT